MWNYRVMRTERSANWEEGEYVIAEVYCGERCDGTNHDIEGWAIGGDCEDQNPGMRPWGTNPDELREVLEMMLTAFDKPVLDEAVLLSEFENEEGVGC